MQIGRVLARTILPLSLAAFVAVGCGDKETGVLGIGGIPDNAFCTVDGTPLLKKDFDTLIESAKQQYKDNGRPFPKKGSDEYDQLRSQAVDYLIQRELTIQQANKHGVEVSEKDVDKALKDLKQQYFQGDEKKFEQELERTGYTEQRVRQDLEDQERSKELYKKITSDIKISDEEAREYYDKKSEQFITKESREVAHILVKDQAKANRLYEQVKDASDEEFARVAKQHTEDDTSKATGGVLTGGIQRGQTVPPFDKAAFSLDTGEVSRPVKSSYGYHIISARSDVKPEQKKPFSEVKDEIKKQLRGETESERFQEWQKEVRKDAEDDVACREGYVWTQTVTETEKNEPAPAAEEPKEEESGDEEKSEDEEKKPADEEKNSDAEKKTDGDKGE